MSSSSSNTDSFAILRIEKAKTRQEVVQRAKHNDRAKETPNSDPERLHLNKEYINLAERPILELLDARTKEAGVGPPGRSNATLCVEVLMTGGPEAAVWQRPAGEDGLPGPAADMRGSQWESDIVAFAKKEWGKNLISLKLHQDELTPHFQAFIVPIVGAGGGRSGQADPKNLSEQLAPDVPARRSARDLFTPPRLAQLQTDYATVVKPHGFKRGIHGSRAQHKDMREMYGLLNKATTEIAPLVEPGHVTPYKLTMPKNPMLWSSWLRDTEKDINARLAASDEKLRLAGKIAVAAAGGNEAAGRSREWVEKEKQHKTDLGSKVSSLEIMVALQKMDLDYKAETVRELTAKLEAARAREADLVEKHLAQQDILILRTLQHTLPAAVKERVNKQFELAVGKGREVVAKALKLPLASEAEFNERLLYKGYQLIEVTAGQPRQLLNTQNGLRFPEVKVRPGGEQGLPLAEQINEVVRATQKASRDKQLDDMQLQQHENHLKNEYWELRRFSADYGRGGHEVARVRVPATAVIALVSSLGSSKAFADDKPGGDGLQGINVSYLPHAASNGMRVTEFIDKVKQLGGEVFELPEARATRERYDISGRQRTRDYGNDKSQELSM